MMHKNDMNKIPAAACGRCGGWTSFGGMSQHSNASVPVMERTGCTCWGSKNDDTHPSTGEKMR